MTRPILHHYTLSSFSEKVRNALGLKNLSYGSVDVAPAPPRPLLAALTGGYRRVPVLQIGADIYCDTNIILPTLERLHPSPTFYPAGSAGVARGLSFAWDRAMWIPTIGVLSHFIGDKLPAEFIKDRHEGYLGIDISKAAMAPSFEAHRQHLHAQYGWLKSALADGRSFIFGDAPSALDLTCHHTIHLLRANCPPEVDAVAGHEALLPWFQRVKAIGHGHPEAMSPEDAFAVAREASPSRPTHLAAHGDPRGLRDGTPVVVTPDDNARVPVHGTLVAASDAEVVIHRHDAEAGDLHLHFPRLGFNVLAA